LALALALPLPASAVMCLKPGSLGPDVPNCTAYQDSPAAKTAVADNLVSVAGEAAAEGFNERLAEDLAGPFRPQRLLARAKSPAFRAGLVPGVAPAPSDLASAGLDSAGADYDHIAGTIVKGTGNAFQAFETAAKPGLGLPAGAAGAAGAAAFPPAAAGPAFPAAAGQTAAAVTPGARAQTAPAGASRGMGSGGAVSIGSLTESDAGRGVFDNAGASLPADGASPAPRAPTVQDCTILHPCAKAD
jgi:hypothetical protein